MIGCRYVTFDDHLAAESCLAAFHTREEPWKIEEREVTVSAMPAPAPSFWSTTSVIIDVYTPWCLVTRTKQSTTQAV